MMRAALLVIFAGLTLPGLLSGQCNAQVEGMVIDLLGKPIPEAKVSFVEVKISGYQQLPRDYLITNSIGKFGGRVSIAHVGEYFAMAMNPEKGYADNRLLIYLNREPPRVLLSCDTPRLGVVIQLGPQVAYIRRLTILDAQTRKPLGRAGLVIRRLSRAVDSTHVASLFLRTAVSGSTPDLKLAVPSEVDISYEISSPGYQTSPRTILHLKPLQDVNLEVTLQRSIGGSG